MIFVKAAAELRFARIERAANKELGSFGCLSNAIKYSGNKDGAKVEIGTIETGAPERSGITYFVRDNGVGNEGATLYFSLPGED